VEIVCPANPIAVDLCWPGDICQDLPIANQTDLVVDGGSWLDGQLCLTAAASGTYTPIVTASNECGVVSCELTIVVTVTGLDLLITDEDVTVSPDQPQPGETVTISAVVHSDERSAVASNVVARFFDGDPSGGVQIGTDQIIPSLAGGEEATVQVEYVVAEPLPRDVYIVVDPTDAFAECAEDNNSAKVTIVSTPIAAAVLGTVRTSSAGLYGVRVMLMDEAASVVRETVTAEDGQYRMDNVPSGAYTVQVDIPVGFVAESAGSVPIVLAGVDQVIDFVLRNTATSGVVDYWAWKREIMAISEGRLGDYRMTRAQIDGYLEAIFDAYYDRDDGLEIRLLNITYTDTPARPMTLDDVLYQWHIVVDDSKLQLGRKFMLADLLNIASLRLSQLALATADGATVAQAIRYFADRFEAGTVDPTLVINIGRIHQGLTIPAGVVPLSTPNVVYKPDETTDEPLFPTGFCLGQNYPNPFNPATEIRFDLPVAAITVLEVYNIQGQRVATLVDKMLEAGEYRVTWNAGEQASGIYLYRLISGESRDSKKMLLLK
jgi:hypothetical protein